MILGMRSIACLAPLAGVLGLFLLDAGSAHAITVSASAVGFYGLGANPCPPGQTVTGTYSASASGGCAIGGDQSTATASAIGGSLATAMLSASATAFGEGLGEAANVYGEATASFTLQGLTVVGDDVPGYIDFIFNESVSENPPGGEGEFVFVRTELTPCTEDPTGKSCFEASDLDFPYTPGEPAFDLTVTLLVEAQANGGLGSTYGNQTAQGSVTLTVNEILAFDQSGHLVPGVTVIESPEPSTLLLLIAAAAFGGGRARRRL